ncbi:MAG: alpha/beta fold hydrolase [Gammaproteobacteria bacterium]|nr:alpha/beta fold hydrolase [Gammaproteobacteria bacterium]
MHTDLTIPDRTKIKLLLGNQLGEVKFQNLQIRNESSYLGRRLLELIFDCNTGESIPAYYIKPPESQSKAPSILYCHAHGNRYDIGKQELLDGRPALQSAYAEDLIRSGYGVLCMEMPCFGERSHLKESSLAKAHFWHGSTLFGQMLAELTAGIDFLSVQEELDKDRIATLGMSMGGTLAWWMHAMDPRIILSVSLCCFADLGSLIEADRHDGHGQYMTVPGLLDYCTTAELAGLSAPHPQLFISGDQDWSTPASCFERARIELERIYRDQQASQQLKMLLEAGVGHEETPSMRATVNQFLHENI